jgi:hypothetical protein
MTPDELRDRLHSRLADISPGGADGPSDPDIVRDS